MATLPPFQELIDEHGRDVLRFLVGSVGPHDAEDCFQETFVSALRSYDGLDHAGNLKGWLLTIAQRKAIDHHRSGARAAVPSGSGDEVGGGVGAADPDIESAGEGGEFWRLVGVLPPKQRSAVVLRFATDMAYGQFCEALDISADSARRNVHEGLKKLRGELA